MNGSIPLLPTNSQQIGNFMLDSDNTVGYQLIEYLRNLPDNVIVVDFKEKKK
tara:strand:+ start:17 stop:172 length:156 start_codon:yes stop_codon:yes gene_type:complete